MQRPLSVPIVPKNYSVSNSKCPVVDAVTKDGSERKPDKKEENKEEEEDTINRGTKPARLIQYLNEVLVLPQITG